MMRVGWVTMEARPDLPFVEALRARGLGVQVYSSDDALGAASAGAVDAVVVEGDVEECLRPWLRRSKDRLPLILRGNVPFIQTITMAFASGGVNRLPPEADTEAAARTISLAVRRRNRLGQWVPLSLMLLSVGLSVLGSVLRYYPADLLEGPGAEYPPSPFGRLSDASFAASIVTIGVSAWRRGFRGRAMAGLMVISGAFTVWMLVDAVRALLAVRFLWPH